MFHNQPVSRDPRNTSSPALSVAAQSIFLSLLLLLSATPFSHAQTETLVYSFAGTPDGAVPSALVRGKSGTFYGTTSSGGTSNLGTIFQVTSKGKEEVLHSFNGADGALPNGGLILDKKGNLYGVTALGGTYNSGTIFVLSHSGTETVLYHFTGGGDGAGPKGPLLFDKAGNLYGVTGGGGTYGQGALFELTPSGVETVFYSFTGRNDGGAPNGGLVRDSKGNLYGTAGTGGTGTFCPGATCGVVFRMSPSGSETVLHSFDGSKAVDGFSPLSGLVRDKSGNLYGTTWLGGFNDKGTVYQVTPSGDETVLIDFAAGEIGYSPMAPLILDKEGRLYGTTSLATYPTCSCGAVFEVTGPNQILLLYDFDNQYSPDGAFPYTGLTFGAKGRLYGTTSAGGAFDKGAVFEVTP